MKNTAELARILKTLGNEDAIKILLFAKSGFESKSDVYTRLGMSIKRYYSRLTTLIKANLVVKRSNRYELTPLGRIVCDFLEGRVGWALANLDQLQLMESLRGLKTVNAGTAKRIALTILGPEANLTYWPQMEGDVIHDYEQMIKKNMDLIESASREMCLATRYTDSRLADVIMSALKRGIRMRILDGDVENMSSRMQLIRWVMSNVKSIKLFYDLFHSPNVEVRFRELPFSFIIIDGEYAGIEMVHPEVKGYFAGVVLKNQELCEMLVELFEELWKDSGPDPLKEFSEYAARERGA